MESAPTRDWIHVSRAGRQIPNHWTTGKSQLQEGLLHHKHPPHPTPSSLLKFHYRGLTSQESKDPQNLPFQRAGISEAIIHNKPQIRDNDVKLAGMTWAREFISILSSVCPSLVSSDFPEESSSGKAEASPPQLPTLQQSPSESVSEASTSDSIDGAVISERPQMDTYVRTHLCPSCWTASSFHQHPYTHINTYMWLH